MRLVQKIVRTGALGKMVAGPVSPPPNLESDEDLETFVRANSIIFWHPLGTAAMASRELGGIVDSDLKVYGTANLRVVDASILPMELGANPMSTIYVIAEKAADIIKKARTG